ncbi:MAG: adenylate/guanylate cyclase domain-containing protein [Elainellaceae cyanobacterium]
MSELSQRPQRESGLIAEIEQLRQTVAQLQQENHDLTIALGNTAEHGDLIETQLHETNQALEAEIAERKLAQATLQAIFEQVCRDKTDLEIILHTIAEHGDTVEYQLYTEAVSIVRQNEELFRAIAESTPILMMLTQQRDGQITYANSISSQRLGVPDQDLIGRSLQEFFVNPSDEHALIAQINQKGWVENYEMQVKNQHGEKFWVSTSLHPLNLANVDTFLTTLYDISDRKQAETDLHQSQALLKAYSQELEQRVEQRTAQLQSAEAKYRSIYENAAEGLFQVSIKGHFLSSNPALAQLYGYDSPEDLVESITDIDRQLYVSPRRHDEILAYLRAIGALSGFESQVYRKDGSRMWVSESLRPVYNSDGDLSHYEGCAWDVSERRQTEEELRQQKILSDRLLLNILPQAVAERLKKKQSIIADHFDDATVLFADLVDFTGLSAVIPPEKTVEMLNAVFSVFDQIADQHHLEKIKTIGDAYMLAGGVPVPMSQHVEATAAAALDMLRAIQTVKIYGDRPLTLRIGIHTGAVVAGVIGKRRFIYDLWGDTVNVASRMEALGEAGKIQVTEEVYAKLKEDYRFEKRGTIPVKGKGMLTTYWLIGKRRLGRRS